MHTYASERREAQNAVDRILDYNLDYNSGQPLPPGVVTRLHRRSSERFTPSGAVQKYGRYLIISAAL